MLVNRLLERNLIHEVGRLDTPGRPMLFGTNDEFLRCFGISSITDLPNFEVISSEQISLDYEDGYMSAIDEKTEAEISNAIHAGSPLLFLVAHEVIDYCKTKNIFAFSKKAWCLKSTETFFIAELFIPGIMERISSTEPMPLS